MKQILPLLQITVATLMMVVILLQAKGSGLSTVFGGEGGFYRSKRGVEKLFVYLTIILAALFLALSITQLLV
ncbi:preprotein translocase subunit SecG [Candidatus Curtissbacteria bacterium]|nr:preprotein translocase subunit SecG [Candidatus Curtissbacteria bacterium]